MRYLDDSARRNGTRAGLAQPDLLEDAGLLARDADPLRSGRSNYRITEPLVTFYQAIMRPPGTPARCLERLYRGS